MYWLVQQPPPPPASPPRQALAAHRIRLSNALLPGTVATEQLRATCSDGLAGFSTDRYTVCACHLCAYYGINLIARQTLFDVCTAPEGTLAMESVTWSAWGRLAAEGEGSPLQLAAKSKRVSKLSPRADEN